MLNVVFDFLTCALYANTIFALLAAFIWGLLSVILSPCHLSSIPLLIAYIGGQGKIVVKKAFFISLMFAFGLLITITLIGFITSLLGRMLGSLGIMENIIIIIVSLIFVAVGLNFIGIIPSPDFFKNKQPDIKKKGLIPAFIMGLLFGVVLGPCTFGFMAPVLSIVFSSASKNLVFSIAILLMYVFGHCLIIIFAGTFTEIVQNYINWDEKSKVSEIVKKIFGAIIIIIGFYIAINNFMPQITQIVR